MRSLVEGSGGAESELPLETDEAASRRRRRRPHKVFWENFAEDHLRLRAALPRCRAETMLVFPSPR